MEVFYPRMANDEEKTLLEMTGKFPVVLDTLRVVKLLDGRVVEAAIKVSEGSQKVVTRKSLGGE